jgi:hypothetical protein
MGQISRVLRDAEGGRLLFWCPGCECCHGIPVEPGTGARWGWNGNVEAPTFTPSILTRWTRTLVGDEEMRRLLSAGQPIPHQDILCHMFVTDGKIQFLADCTHPLAGQTVPMVEYPEWGNP